MSDCQTWIVQVLQRIYCFGHARAWGSEQVDLLALRAQVVGKIKMSKGGITKTIYKWLLVEDTRNDEIAWSSVLEFEMKCASSKKGHVREWIRYLYSRQEIGTIQHLHSICWRSQGIYEFVLNTMMSILDNKSNVNFCYVTHHTTVIIQFFFAISLSLFLLNDYNYPF